MKALSGCLFLCVFDERIRPLIHQDALCDVFVLVAIMALAGKSTNRELQAVKPIYRPTASTMLSQSDWT